MAQSIRDIVCSINEALKSTFKEAVYYGIATPMATEGKSQPVVDERPVTYDDSFAMQVYHKVGAVKITYKGGYGNNNNTTNTFAMSAIVFNNEKKTKLRSDEIAMIIQARLSNITSDVTPNDFILNTDVILATEYRGHDNRLPSNMSLMQLNYTVAITFKSGCFDLCPEDFSSCKNN